MKKIPGSRNLRLERLQSRLAFSSVPFGASPNDTAEFMLGDVLVSLVLFESDGSIDANTEDWDRAQVVDLKQTVESGLNWWVEMLNRQESIHTLNFQLDYTYADSPISTGYEPISRTSDQVHFWMNDFFAEVGIDTSGSPSEKILQFNHAQRVKYETNWAFTIFVVDSQADPDHRFAEGGSVSSAFAVAGGQFIVMPSERPPSTVAHEVGHMFWALDEYANSASYSAHRGYYNSQNLNANDGHPEPSERVESILDSSSVGFRKYALSSSAMEMIGWKDSDQDGIFDVLDVPLQLSGSGQFNVEDATYRFIGSASVTTLPNQNPSGTGNDITFNQISRIEFRTDQSDWQSLAEYHTYVVDEIDVSFDVPEDIDSIEIRVIDDATGVTSDVFAADMQRPVEFSWQNGFQPADVNDDGFTSPIDVLLIVNEINRAGARKLPKLDALPFAFVDVNGDGYLAPQDILVVVNEINSRLPVAAIESEPSDDFAAAVDALFEFEASDQKLSKLRL